MKGIIRILFGVVALTTFCGTVSAQTGKQRLTREQLAEVQAKHIAKEMAMDDATSQRFIDTFCQFQRDIWALGPRPKHPNDQRPQGIRCNPILPRHRNSFRHHQAIG